MRLRFVDGLRPFKARLKVLFTSIDAEANRLATDTLLYLSLKETLQPPARIRFPL